MVPVKPVPLAQFSATAQTALCDWAVGCRHMPDQATCLSLIDPKNYDTRRTVDAVESGRIVYDPAAAGECLVATREAFCLAVPFSDESCARYLIGTVAEGGACTSSFECEEGAACEEQECGAQCCVGTCGAAVVVTPPQLADIGEPCVQHSDCVVEAACGTDRRCTAYPTAPGEPCVFGCARGDLYCDLSDLRCRQYAAPGQTCDAEGALAPPCDPAHSVCDGVCGPRPRAGEPCDDESRLCVATTVCDGGVCTERAAIGQSCDDSRDCVEVCDSAAGVCVGYERCTID